jgi:hypothetical protein
MHSGDDWNHRARSFLEGSSVMGNHQATGHANKEETIEDKEEHERRFHRLGQHGLGLGAV